MAEEFSWVALDGDEEIVWSGHPRRHVILWVAVIGLVLPGVLAFVGPTVPGAVLGIVGWAILVSISYLYVSNIEYVVTTKYVYSKWGIYARQVTQIGLHNIQDTTLMQGIFGTQFEHGTISFSTAGGEGAALKFYLVDEPRAVKTAVDRQVTAAAKGSTEREAPVESGGFDALLSEFRATREVAQRIDQTLTQEDNS